jgi:hypothetical protein
MGILVLRVLAEHLEYWLMPDVLDFLGLYLATVRRIDTTMPVGLELSLVFDSIRVLLDSMHFPKRPQMVRLLGHTQMSQRWYTRAYPL